MYRRSNFMGGKRIRKKQDAIDLVNEQHRLHRGKWLTLEVAKQYQKRAYELNNSTYEIHKLMLELRKEYGITQLEAINILNGHHIADYVNKYYRIQNLIPLDIKEKTTDKKNEEDE